MRIVIQRVTEASVTVAAEEYKSCIGKGLLVLAAFIDEDTEDDLVWTARKIAAMRIFDDEGGVMNLSVKDVEGEILAVSQFTLYADTSSRRPGFSYAAKPDIAIPLYERFMAQCRERGFEVQHGEFGADMQVFSQNDGPVTILLDIE